MKVTYLNNRSKARQNSHQKLYWFWILFLSALVILFGSLPFLRSFACGNQIWFLDGLLRKAWWYNVNQIVLSRYIYFFVPLALCWLATQLPVYKRLAAKKTWLAPVLLGGVSLTVGYIYLLGYIAVGLATVDIPSTLPLIFQYCWEPLGIALLAGATAIGVHFLLRFLRSRLHKVLPAAQDQPQ